MKSNTGWPQSMADVAVARFIPFSIELAKQAAKRLRDEINAGVLNYRYCGLGAKTTLSRSQRAISLALGFADWHELDATVKAHKLPATPLDDRCSDEVVQQRRMQHTAAFAEVFDIHGKAAYDLACFLMLTGSTAQRAQIDDLKTPWGLAYETEEVAEGIVIMHTGGHGGIHLSKARNAEMPAHLRMPEGWYEEDCDAALVEIAFPDLFDPNPLYSLSALHVVSNVPWPRPEDEECAQTLERLMPERKWDPRGPNEDELAVGRYLAECLRQNRRPAALPDRDGLPLPYATLAEWTALLRPHAVAVKSLHLGDASWTGASHWLNYVDACERAGTIFDPDMFDANNPDE